MTAALVVRVASLGAAAAGCIAVASFACSAASTATVANVAGTYSLSIVDGTNACQLSGVHEGGATSGTLLQVAQDSTTPQNMSVTLEGAAGQVLSASVGTNVMIGTLGGLQATLAPGGPDGGVAPNPPSLSSGGCSFTVNASLLLNFAGDTVQGTMTYTLVTSGAACGALATCQTVQALAGVLTPGDS